MKMILILLMAWSVNSVADEMKDVAIKVTSVRGNVYMLQGAGGNIGVLATNDGLIMIDDEFAPLAPRIQVAMRGISDKPIKYIINTHFHGDHTGSNSFFAKQAPIIAQANVRTRLMANPADKQVALPILTYDSGMDIYLGAEDVELMHLAHGHTDGDTAVYFKHANVLHTGDLFFEIGFPFVDLKHGGSVKGYLADVRYLIANTPDDVMIIPGHGKLTNKKRYIEFANMIDYSIKLVERELAAGLTEQQIMQQGIGKQYQQWSWSFVNEKKWLQTLIDDLKP